VAAAAVVGAVGGPPMLWAVWGTAAGTGGRARRAAGTGAAGRGGDGTTAGTGGDGTTARTDGTAAATAVLREEETERNEPTWGARGRS
jgi:hypothetical protein